MGHSELAAAFGSTPFTRAEAYALGVTFKMVTSKRYRRLFHGLYVAADASPSDRDLFDGLRRSRGGELVLDGLSALRARGLDLGTPRPLTVATPQARLVRMRGVAARRYRRLPSCDTHRVADVGPAYHRVCRDLSLTDAVIVGDRLLHLGIASSDELRIRHPAIRFVRGGAESPRETLLRLALVLGGLPEPECNAWIYDDGHRVARVDLYYRAYRVALEYEGDRHRTDRRQWQRDIDRFSSLSRLGIETLRVTAAHLRHANNVVVETYKALSERGYAGPPPDFSRAWEQTFLRQPGLSWQDVPVSRL